MEQQKKKKEKTVAVPAPIIRRLGALFIDLFLLNIVVWQWFAFLFPKKITLHFSIPESQMTRIMIGIIIIMIYTLLYFIVFEMKFQQTLGEWIMKIKIVCENTQSPLLAHLLNNLFLIPFFPFTIIWFIEPWYLLFFNQRFLEKISHCKTIYEIPLQPQKKEKVW